MNKPKDIKEFAIQHCRKPHRLAVVLECLLKAYHNGEGVTSITISEDIGWSDRTIRYYLKLLKDWEFIDKQNIFVSEAVAKKAGLVVGLIQKGRSKYIQFEGYYVSVYLKEPLRKCKYEQFRNIIIEWVKEEGIGVKIIPQSALCLGIYFPRFIELPQIALAKLLTMLHRVLSDLTKDFGAEFGNYERCEIMQQSCHFKLIGRIGVKEFSMFNHPIAIEHYKRNDKHKSKYVSIDFSSPAPSLEFTAKSHDQLIYLVQSFLKREEEQPFINVGEIAQYCHEVMGDPLVYDNNGM